MSIKINKNGKEYDLGFIPEHYPADRVYLDGDTSKTVQDIFDNLSKIVKKKTLTVNTNNSNKVAPIGLYTTNAIPIAVSCGGMNAYIGSTYQNEWYVALFDYATGAPIQLASKEITVYYIDLTKISVQSD